MRRSQQTTRNLESVHLHDIASSVSKKVPYWYSYGERLVPKQYGPAGTLKVRGDRVQLQFGLPDENPG
jgi:hypothetical protein